MFTLLLSCPETALKWDSQISCSFSFSCSGEITPISFLHIKAKTNNNVLSLGLMDGEDFTTDWRQKVQEISHIRRGTYLKELSS